MEVFSATVKIANERVHSYVFIRSCDLHICWNHFHMLRSFTIKKSKAYANIAWKIERFSITMSSVRLFARIDWIEQSLTPHPTPMFENTYFTIFFSDFKKTWLFTFIEMTFQKNLKSHKKYQVCWMFIEILASKPPSVMGTYMNLSHTVLSCKWHSVAVSWNTSINGYTFTFMSSLLSKMFDVGDRDLPLLTSGNWVVKGCITNWLRFYVFTFFTFFGNPKKHDFLRFLRCCTRFLEHCPTQYRSFPRRSSQPVTWLLLTNKQ